VIALALFILFVLFLPLLFVILFFNIITISFVKLGIPRWTVLFLFAACLIGSLINIPVWHGLPSTPSPFYFHPPSVSAPIIAVNVGGCVIPTLIALYLLWKAPLLKTAIATVLITGLAYWLAEPVPGVGIQMPFFIAPIASAAIALILTRGRNAAPVAYVSGVLGTLIGADLLNLSALGTGGVQIISIGGAGVFDGIFLTGIVAAFLA
jgi:uncharacterized membrane protein